jgi:hypothetical protein
MSRCVVAVSDVAALRSGAAVERRLTSRALLATIVVFLVAGGCAENGVIVSKQHVPSQYTIYIGNMLVKDKGGLWEGKVPILQYQTDLFIVDIKPDGAKFGDPQRYYFESREKYDSIAVGDKIKYVPGGSMSGYKIIKRRLTEEEFQAAINHPMSASKTTTQPQEDGQ